MPHPLRTEFVLADGSRARWVRRSEAADDFVTVREVAAKRLETTPPQGVAFGSSGQRFTVGGRNSEAHIGADRFAAEIAELLNAQAAAGEFERLAVVAPARTLNAIRDHLSQPARKALARTLAKDLTKTPDHELRSWLHPLEQE